jgi:hypothetical protein
MATNQLQDETTLEPSKLFSEGKTPLQVAIMLNLEAEKAIQYHQQYYMLLGCTEFTRVYLQIKDNPWPYVNFVKLSHNSGISDDEVIGILNLAREHLPRVRLEYDRLEAELNSVTRTYQQFCDRNIELKNREDELLNT